jgi:hypothetical protein
MEYAVADNIVAVPSSCWSLGCAWPPKQALKALLSANKRFNTAYVLKESFAQQLWDYGHVGWARKFFENWRASLKRQRPKSYERFAAMIDRHAGLIVVSKPECGRSACCRRWLTASKAANGSV